MHGFKGLVAPPIELGRMAGDNELLGKLVEIHGFTDPLEEDAYLRDPGTQPSTLPNGKIGRAILFNSQISKFVVHTFDDLLLAIEVGNLKEYVLKDPQDGGFDLTWPTDESEFFKFAPVVMHALREKQYCKVQMYMGEDQQRQAMKEIGELSFTRMKAETELAYLGRNKESQVCWVEGNTDAAENDTLNLQACDQYFGTFCNLIQPLTNPALGFAADCRTNLMVRRPLADANIKQTSIDEEDLENGVVDSHISFCRRRRLCMIMVVESVEANITLIPEAADKPKVHLPLAKGQLLVFDHASLSYEFKASNMNDTLLQSWLLADPPAQQLQAVYLDSATKDAAMGLFTGPKTPDTGNCSCIMSAVPGLPCAAHDDFNKWWVGLAYGTDAFIKAPTSRFEIDPYYLPNETWEVGYTYTVHAGFVDEDIYSFDNRFFKIPDKEAYITNPNMRKCLEHGYQCLYLAGHRRETMRSKRIGLYAGACCGGDDWTTGLAFTTGATNEYRKGLSNRSWNYYYQQIAHTFGVTGPCVVVDTACSSALVSYSVAHNELRRPEIGQQVSGCDSHLTDVLVLGSNLCTGGLQFTVMCGPHMLSPKGRCFTFDESADGYARGEGTGSIFVKAATLVPEECIAVAGGACTNQDGRSASLTAPNGPAQTACILKCMKEAGREPDEINCAECHGTGTALGDPIELGALRAVFDKKFSPLVLNTAKAHIGHLEGSAGLAGFLKCISMNEACCGTPSPHLVALNPMLDMNGYPTTFCTELVPFGSNSGITGVSSFGWGGANARVDLWAACRRGASKVVKPSAASVNRLADYMEATCPIDDGPMYHLDGQPVQSPEDYVARSHHACCIRDEFASYDCSVYDGPYQLPPQVDEIPAKPLDGTVCIVGSWTACSEMQQMDEKSDFYSFVVPLGETRCEHFNFVLEKGPYKLNIYPVVDHGSMYTRVLGPEVAGEDNRWLLDGRDDKVPSGTMYMIRLHWGAKPKVSWERLPGTEVSQTVSSEFAHTYQVMGTFTSWKAYPMNPVEGVNSCFETKLKISRGESFQFTRDFDIKQKIYPVCLKASDGSTPVRGPDHMGEGKNFYIDIAGSETEMVTLRLQVSDGHIIVEAIQPAKSTKWESVEGPGRHSYFVRGSWNNFEPLPMTPDLTNPGVYTCLGVPQSSNEVFTIFVDDDSNFQLYPEMSATPGKVACKGPDNECSDEEWQILALTPQSKFQIKLDFTAVNKKDRVTLLWLTGPVDIKSMELLIKSSYGEAYGQLTGMEDAGKPIYV